MFPESDAEWCPSYWTIIIELVVTPFYLFVSVSLALCLILFRFAIISLILLVSILIILHIQFSTVFNVMSNLYSVNKLFIYHPFISLHVSCLVCPFLVEICWPFKSCCSQEEIKVVQFPLSLFTTVLGLAWINHFLFQMDWPLSSKSSQHADDCEYFT